jgi:hypothetical protein
MLIWQKKKGASLIQQQHCSRLAGSINMRKFTYLSYGSVSSINKKNLKKSIGFGFLTFYGAPILKKTGTFSFSQNRVISHI